MVLLREAIYNTLEAENPMTVRQVFYQLVSQGAIDKTEAEYKRTVVRLLTQMRHDRLIPFAWISDNTRWMRKPITHSSLAEALQTAQATYRRNVWDDQETYVEVWLEKDALAGVLYEVTSMWHVPLMVTRGYASISYLYEAAEALAAKGKPASIYYFGDHDPSGRDITRHTEKSLREFAPNAEIDFLRVAVTEEQIAAWRLPTRPTKSSDSRSKSFSGESVEVDAIPPRTLRDLARYYIEAHIDQRILEQTQMIEEQERQTLERLTETLEKGKRQQ